MSPTDCAQVLKEIELYLDGELTASACNEIKAHLSECIPCTDHAEFRKRLAELIGRKCGCEEAPAELIERIRFRLEGAEPT